MSALDLRLQRARRSGHWVLSLPPLGESSPVRASFKARDYVQFYAACRSLGLSFDGSDSALALAKKLGAL